MVGELDQDGIRKEWINNQNKRNHQYFINLGNKNPTHL